jgi:hypothetical protein
MPSQIPKVWEAVKYAVHQLDEIPAEQMPAYRVWLLHQLLSEKAQCWVTLNEDRVLLNVSLTRISTNTSTGRRELHLQCLYAFQGLTDQTVTEALALYRAFAKQSGCAIITGASRHSRACALMEQHGFQPQYRTYTLGIGGV